MKKQELENLYGYYVDTINNCGVSLLKEKDEIIEYKIFEDFDIGVISALYENNLKELMDGGFINHYQMQESLKLRQMVFDLKSNNEWNMQAFRTSPNWKNVLELADTLKKI